MKKPCPNLVQLDDDALRAFWQSHRPGEIRQLGDHLLAESLPRFPRRGPEFYLDNPAEKRQLFNKSLEQVAQELDVNPVVLAAWESGIVRPPASLALIYGRLSN